jgi:trehalose 6-phosphate phosphatase
MSTSRTGVSYGPAVSAPARLVRFRSEPAAAAILLDVDGTLAPIVERPEDAGVPEEARREVERLAGRYALVACITGRPSADARRMVALDGVEYVGVHGLESHPDVTRYEPAIRRLIETADWPWRVEEKAGVTAAFHYREVDDDEAAAPVERVVRAAEEAGLAVQRGRKVVEVLPPIDADKGTAIVSLLAKRGLDRALYAGDDTTDLDAFRGLDRAGLDAAVKVAVASREMNPALLNAADFVVDGPQGLLELLRQL